VLVAHVRICAGRRVTSVPTVPLLSWRAWSLTLIEKAFLAPSPPADPVLATFSTVLLALAVSAALSAIFMAFSVSGHSTP
jgi:hypothetical protein